MQEPSDSVMTEPGSTALLPFCVAAETSSFPTGLESLAFEEPVLALDLGDESSLFPTSAEGESSSETGESSVI